MTHSSFDTPFEIKFLAETGAFEGYASVFHVTDSVNDRVAPGAFRRSLAQFGEEGRLPPLLWQHDTSEPIGAWREMYEDEHGLYVKGELFVDDIPLAREAMKLLKENVVTGLSIGYRARAAHKDSVSGARVLTEIDLHEVSLVTFPANDYARVSKIKRPFTPEAPPSPREFETFLRASGLSRGQAKGLMACGYKGLAQAQDHAATDLIATVRAATRAVKYNQNQPRVPAGNPTGGEWTDGGVTSRTAGAVPGVTRPRRITAQGGKVVRVRRQKPEASRLEDGHVNPTWSPLDFIGFPARSVIRVAGQVTEPVVAEGITEARHLYNVAKLRYIKRGISGLEEVGSDVQELSKQQLGNLKRMVKRNPGFKDSMKVTRYSDDSAVIHFDKPADSIPNSYARYEKHVGSDGETRYAIKVTYDKNEKIVHIRDKMK